MHRSLIITAVVFLIACVSAAEPSEVRVLGAIAGYNNDDPRIEISVDTGVVRVKVTTYGGGCHKKGPTQVQVVGRIAVIIPYDYTAPPKTVCTLPLLSFVHDTTVRFELSGTVHVQVRGMDHRGRSAANQMGNPITVERIVTLP